MRAVYPSNTTSFEPIIFPNQDHFGKEIAAEFMDRNIVSILALALTQSGKTGSMLGVIKHCLAEPSLAVPMENIFVITGYSSTEWVEQTRDRFPEELRERVFHRNRFLRVRPLEVRNGPRRLICCAPTLLDARLRIS